MPNTTKLSLLVRSTNRGDSMSSHPVLLSLNAGVSVYACTNTYRKFSSEHVCFLKDTCMTLFAAVVRLNQHTSPGSELLSRRLTLSPATVTFL